MGRVLNISNKLDREPRFLVLDDKHRYKVDCTKNAVTKVLALESEDGKDLDYIDQAMKLLLGNEAVKEINAMELPVDNLNLILRAALAVATNREFKDEGESFREGL